MPALPSPGKVLSIKYNLTIGQDTFGLCRQYYSYTGSPPTPGQVAALAATVRGSFGANLAQLFSAAVSLTSTVVNDLGSATGAVGTDNVLVTGNRAGVQLPGGTCLLYNYTVARKYRGGHPRTYWPMGVVADLLNEQQWTAAFLNSVNTQLGIHDVAIEGGVWSGGGALDQVNVSFYAGFTVVTNPITGRARNVPRVRSGMPPLTLPLVDVLNEGSANPKPAYQRRRGLHSR